MAIEVFISWSGVLSRNIAEIFMLWLPKVVPSAKPFYSPEDTVKGTRWNSQIARKLEKARVGLIFLTKDNLDAPWIMFEAGALAKNVEASRVCPILFDLIPAEVQGPLNQFQVAQFEKVEIRRVIPMINRASGTSAISSGMLDSLFEKWWPGLEESINAELKKARRRRKVSVRGAEAFRSFPDTQQLYEYVTKRILEAKRTVDDLTWGYAEEERTPASQKAFEQYLLTISTVCSKSNAISYREIMSFPPKDHIKRAESMLSKKAFSYRLRYYLLSQEMPLLTFMLIDSEEVIFAFYRAPFLPAEREVRLATKEPVIVNLFQDYYDTIWQGANILKEGNKTELGKLKSIKKWLTDIP